MSGLTSTQMWHRKYGEWPLIRSFSPIDGKLPNAFGTAVGLDNDTAIVGNEADANPGPFSGAAYALSNLPSATLLADGFKAIAAKP